MQEKKISLHCSLLRLKTAYPKADCQREARGLHFILFKITSPHF